MKKTYIILILSFFGFSSKAQDSLFDSLCSKWNAQIAIVQDDSLIYNKAFGVASLVDSSALTIEHDIELSELSTIYLLAKLDWLEKANVLKRTDSVSFHIPNFPYSITIDQLIDHKSGLNSNYIKWYHRYIFRDQNIKMKDKCRAVGNEDIIDIIINFTPPLDFEPGSKTQYSNCNYIILNQIVNKNYNLLLSHNHGYDAVLKKTFKTYFNLGVIAHGIMHEAGNFYKHGESLKDIGFQYWDETTGHQNVYSSAEKIAQYAIKLEDTEITGQNIGHFSYILKKGKIILVIVSNCEVDISKTPEFEQLKKTVFE